MSWDLLLEWMTHSGSGTWSGFREAVAELHEPTEADVQVVAKRLRIVLSDLGHVEFFINASKRWQVLRPAIVGLAHPHQYLFVGGRTRQLVTSLEHHCREQHLSFTCSRVDPGLSRIALEGDREAVQRLATSLGIEFIPEASRFLISRVTPVRRALESAQSCVEPINWEVHSWSFEDEKWVTQQLRRTVRLYTNRHGVRRYILDRGNAGACELGKREALYAAALQKGVRLVKHSPESSTVTVPWWAPLPESYSRATCLAGGKVAVARGNDLVFESVPNDVASVLLVGLGQGSNAKVATV